MAEQETQTIYVVQRCKAKGDELKWADASEHSTEAEARDQFATYVVELGDVLGPFRVVRRTETVI